MKKYILLYILLFAATIQGCINKDTENNNGEIQNLIGTVGSKPSGKFLIMSDIHFNPYYDHSTLAKIVKADYTDWPKIFDSAIDSSYGYYGSDTYYKLFLSGLEAMQAQDSTPDMIVINGDFLSHHFTSNFYNQTSGMNAGAAQAFVEKTISFVLMMIENRFPGVPILPVIGNNDDFSGDYNIQPDGPFLSFFANLCKPMLKKMHQTDFVATVSKGGYYKVTMPWDSTQAFIGLNTIFFSSRYDTTKPVPAKDELAWLEQTLADCKANGQKAWLSYHIPPGMDIHNTAGLNPCGAELMWQERFNADFIALINKYSDVIKGNYAGHTHMDEFRLMSDGKKATSFVHITPAISPIFGNNPAFVELTWDPAKMELLNSVTYRFGGIQTPGSNTWKEEYNYGKTYGLTSINAGSLDTLWQKMDADPTLHADYAKYYTVNNPNQSISPWKTYWCGARYMDTEEFVKCNCK